MLYQLYLGQMKKKTLQSSYFNFLTLTFVSSGDFSSLEEAYQTLGFVESDPEIAEKIKNSHSAHEAQKIAYANRDKRQENWDEIKVSIMEELLREKLNQNPYVEKKLLETKDYLIVEDSPKDSFWGWGEDRNGDAHWKD